jgi:hypothetical protein
MRLTKEQQEVMDSRDESAHDKETQEVDRVFRHLFRPTSPFRGIKGDDNAARFEAELRIYLRA